MEKKIKNNKKIILLYETYVRKEGCYKFLSDGHHFRHVIITALSAIIIFADARRAIRFLRGNEASPLIRQTARNYARSAYRGIVSVARRELRARMSQDAHVDSFLSLIRTREPSHFVQTSKGMCPNNFPRSTRRRIFMYGDYVKITSAES